MFSEGLKRGSALWRTVLGVVIGLYALNTPQLEQADALSNPSAPSSPSSTASLDIDLSVATLFRISGIADLSFGSYAGSGSLTRDDDVCVWTNSANGNYRITARGNGASYAFVVSKSGDATVNIPYTVRWNTISGTSGNFALSTNVASTNLSGANTQSSTCATGPAATANFQVSFAQTDLLSAPSGTYSGTLTFVVSAPT